MKLHPYFNNHALSEGKLWVDDTHLFVKTGKPLRDYSQAGSIDLLIEDLPTVARRSPIWPELEATLKAHRAHNYSIFLAVISQH